MCFEEKVYCRCEGKLAVSGRVTGRVQTELEPGCERREGGESKERGAKRAKSTKGLHSQKWSRFL